MNLKNCTGLATVIVVTALLVLAFHPVIAVEPENTPAPSPPSVQPETAVPSSSPSVMEETSSPSPSAEPSPAKPQDQLSEAVSAMAKVQTLLEYFYMEMGEYPSTLSEMEEMFNTRIPENYEKITIPRDPATQKQFRYEVRNRKSSYVLSLPDAARYGCGPLRLTNISWGWMKRMAGEERKGSLLTACKNTLSSLATTIEVCAFDRRGKYPANLSMLIPLYMNSIPCCPLSHKEYVYRFKGKQYEISCPTPELHGLESLKYISNEGLRYKK